MFSVIFEVHPKSSQWDAYLALGKLLKPELEQIDGFIDNVRYRSLTRDGWLVSLSEWRDEKSLVRWRVRAKHHDVQELGRGQIFVDYHLRIGQSTRDTHVPVGHELLEQRLDKTTTGAATTAILINATRTVDLIQRTRPRDFAECLGLDKNAEGLVEWDVFDSVLTPGDVLLLLSWRDQQSAEIFQDRRLLKDNTRLRCIRIIRDYGMFDRREAPQFYPDADGTPTIHF